MRAHYRLDLVPSDLGHIDFVFVDDDLVATEDLSTDELAQKASLKGTALTVPPQPIAMMVLVLHRQWPLRQP